MSVLKKKSLLKTILFLTLFPLFIFQIISIYINYKTTETSLMKEKKQMLQNIVHSVVEQLHSLEKQVKMGELSDEQAKKIARSYIKDLRYGEDDYFWVNDFGPKMIIHPTKPQLEGKNIGEVQDKKGKKLFSVMVSELQNKDVAFVDYFWSSKKDANISVPKLSLVQAFRPWGWIVGTGIYLEDVKEHIRTEVYKGTSFLLFFLLIIALITTILIKKSIIDPLSFVSSSLHTISKNVEKESYQSLKSAEVLNRSSHQQSEIVELTNQSVSQMVETINKSYDSAHDASEKTLNASKKAEIGCDRIDEMIHTIKGLAEQNHEISQKLNANLSRFNEVKDIIHNINEKTNVINDIVFQTKLLSFNASVEAARAGSQGKGFAVVAEEIANLASMSGDASHEISVLLNNSVEQVDAIIKKASEVTDQMIETTKNSVEEGEKKAIDTKDSFESIRGEISEVQSGFKFVLENFGHQKEILDHISQTVKELEDVTSSGQEVSVKAKENAKLLKGEANELNSATSTVLYLIKGGKNNYSLDTLGDDADDKKYIA